MYLIFSLSISFATALFEILRGGEGVIVIPYGIVIPTLILLPRLFWGRSRNITQQYALHRIELFTFIAVLFNAPASLYLHDLGLQYDRFLHFSMGFVSLLICYFLLLSWWGEKVSRKQLVFISSIIIFIGLFAFEGLQFSIDYIFGTKLFFDTTQLITYDFTEDIFFGFLGLTGALFTRLVSTK